MSLPDARTDNELINILDEPETRIITSQGRRLCFTASFRTAIERGSALARAGAIVTTLSRQSDNVIVPQSQMCRLRKLIANKVLPVVP
jgi:hypothetical protein